MCVCVCVCVWCVCVCVVSVIVKRPVLPPCVVDGRSRNPLYYDYYIRVTGNITASVQEHSNCPQSRAGREGVTDNAYCFGPQMLNIQESLAISHAASVHAGLTVWNHPHPHPTFMHYHGVHEDPGVGLRVVHLR